MKINLLTLKLMSLYRFVIFLFFVFNTYVIRCNDARIRRRREKKELKAIMRTNEMSARRDFFMSYGQMQRDVDVLKKRNAKSRIKSLKKFYPQRLLQFGIYGYSDVPSLLKYFKSGSGNEGGYILKPKDDKKVSELSPLLVAGVVFDINFSKHSGLSTIFAYSIFKKTQSNDVVAFESGYTGILLFKFSGLPLPFSIVTDFLPNFLDPLFWILRLTHLYYKVELLTGFKISFWSEVRPGTFGFSVTDNTFKKLKRFVDTRSSRTVLENFLTLINEHTYSERRVYITRYVFYSLNTVLAIPIIISFLQSGCNKTFEWLKKNYMSIDLWHFYR